MRRFGGQFEIVVSTRNLWRAWRDFRPLKGTPAWALVPFRGLTLSSTGLLVPCGVAGTAESPVPENSPIRVSQNFRTPELVVGRFPTFCDRIVSSDVISLTKLSGLSDINAKKRHFCQQNMLFYRQICHETDKFVISMPNVATRGCTPGPPKAKRPEDQRLAGATATRKPRPPLRYPGRSLRRQAARRCSAGWPQPPPRTLLRISSESSNFTGTSSTHHSQTLPARSQCP